MTTTEIEVWAYTVSNTVSKSTDSSVLFVTSSIRPPPFTVIDNPNPKSQSGISHPPVTRTVTPPPYPYTFTTPDTQETSPTTSSDGAAVVVFPIVTFKPGSPGPICKSGCGTSCLIFCDHPCLLDCPDGGQDFGDPNDPSPDPKPKPKPTNDPLPTLPPSTDSDPPPDQDQDDPGDPEEEDTDQECALEFDLPLPTYDGDIGASTSSETIAPPTSTPSPSPPPPPSKPSPNPTTESLHCYNAGALVDRDDMMKAINSFCDQYEGTTLDATDPDSKQTLAHWVGAACIGDGCFDYVSVTLTVINGCAFKVDGSSASDECGRILREAVDRCDTSSTRFKQGGTVESNCAKWLIDPNIWWD